jgi:hypothetical protein
MPVMGYSPWVLLIEVFIKAASQGNIDYLAATANPEHGFIYAHGSLDQVYLDPVAIGINTLNSGMR